MGYNGDGIRNTFLGRRGVPRGPQPAAFERGTMQRSRLPRSRLVAGALAVCAFAPRPSRAQTPLTVRIAGAATEDSTPIVYAIQTGMYTKAGLDVTFVPVSSGSAATQAVLGGAVEVTKASLTGAFNAHLRGLPIVIIGNANTWAPQSPFSLMVVSSDSTVKTAADLNGATMSSTGLEDENSLAMRVWMDKNGGDSGTVKWVEIPNSGAAEAVISHRVAATMLNEPALSAAVATGKVRVLSAPYGAIAQHFATAAYIARSDWATSHAAAVKAFTKTTYDAAAYTNVHTSDTVEMMSQFTKIPIDVYRKMPRAVVSTDGDPAMIQPLLDMAAKYHFISRAFPAGDAYFKG